LDENRFTVAGPGSQYFGRYRAQRVLGAGAFATVWLAEDETLAAAVAIKVLAENWSHDDEVRRRFIEEARILWRADSDHIVRIRNVEVLPDGRPYFVMDFADRGTLYERMRGRFEAGGRYSVEEAVALSLEIAEGLKVAHGLKVVHRDLKPANILFQSVPAHHGASRDERLMLTDFGMAKSLARSRGTTIATGTPYYMAPEQVEGRADERSDIYSAGVVLYELLAGRVPYAYDSPGRLFAAQTAEPPDPIGTLRDDVPAVLTEAIERALTTDPAQRWQSAQEWADALAAARTEAPAPAETLLPGVDPDQLLTLAPSQLAAQKANQPVPSHNQPVPSHATVAGTLPPAAPVPTPAAVSAPSGRRRRRRHMLTIGGTIALVLAGVAAAVIALVLTGGKAPKPNLAQVAAAAAGVSHATPPPPSRSSPPPPPAASSSRTAPAIDTSQFAASTCGGGNPVADFTSSYTDNPVATTVAGTRLYWALVTGRARWRVWATGGGNYCAIDSGSGTFTTLAGRSPAGTGSVRAGLQGTYVSDGRSTFTGTWSPKRSTTGDLGTLVAECTVSQDHTNATCRTAVDWHSFFFSTSSASTERALAVLYSTNQNGSLLTTLSGLRGDITG
jgi:serine/threonine protein kinase